MLLSLTDNAMFRKILINPVYFFCALSFFVAGCGSLGTYNPATGKNEFLLITTNQEVVMGKDVHKSILKEYKLSADTEKAQRLSRIGQRVALVSDRQDYVYNFYLIEEEELNAFTTPGGSIYFFTGLFDKMQTDDQIAAVLAHEIGHCAAKHTIKKFQSAMGYDLIMRIVLSQLSESAAPVASLSSSAIMNIVFSAYSRKDEYEADRLGVKYLHLSGYDPQSMVESLAILKKESKGSVVPGFLMSHPHLDDRIAIIKQHIQALDNQ